MENEPVQAEPESDAHAAVDRFLAQPPESGIGDEPEEALAPAQVPPRTLWQAIVHFLFEKEPSAYSSISPRKADGTRTKPFFFNGGGRGR